ncbi:MAG: hypothetical protein A2Y24_05350 [Clostridiales bacterium GWE2_32_10]|nr:MAG: hypothetical protein A2Y24_05350 [Clostridiales bacterium GWE2_32_10]HBY19896.1 hypothetical protein [Clostridiales bacterium]
MNKNYSLNDELSEHPKVIVEVECKKCFTRTYVYLDDARYNDTVNEILFLNDTQTSIDEWVNEAILRQKNNF